MKHVIAFQILLLLLAVGFGLALKSDLASGIRQFHALAGMTSGLISLLTVGLAFKTKQTTLVKALAVVSMLLVFSAGWGGSSLKNTSNYDLAYMQMAFSGLLALLVSVGLFFKVKVT